MSPTGTSRFAALAALAASGIVLGAVISDGFAPQGPPLWVAPLPEPWLRPLAVGCLWIALFTAVFVGREIVRALREIRTWSRGR